MKTILLHRFPLRHAVLGMISMILTITSIMAAVPIHHYDFNAAAVHDTAGSVDGALIGAARVENGVLITDGVSGYVEFPANLIPVLPPFSVAMFARDRGSNPPYNDPYVELISQGYTMGPGFYLGYDPDRRIRIGDQILNSGLSYPSDGGWHHYAVTAATDETRLYIDGNLAGRFRAIVAAPGGSRTRLGRQFDPYGEFFNGLMDELWIFDGVLSEAEISNLATQPHGGNSQTLSWTGTTNNILALNTAYPLGAQSSSGLPVTLRVESGPAVIENGSLKVTALGAVTVTVTQPGDSQYLPATLTRSFNAPHVVLRYITSILSGANDIKIVGNYAYVAASGTDSGLVILDVSNPATPVRVGHFAMPDEPLKISVAGNHASLIVPAPQALWIFDVSNPSNPVPTGGASGVFFATASRGNYVYTLEIPANQNGYLLRVLEISGDGRASTVAADNVSYSTDLTFIGDTLFLAGAVLAGPQTGVIYDMTDPKHPLLKGHFTAPFAPNFIAAADNHIYGLGESFWVADPNGGTPQVLGELPLDSLEYYAFTAAPLFAFIARSGGVDVVDISDPATPIVAGRNSLNLNAAAVQSLDKYVYLAGRARGVVVFDARYAYDQEITLGAPSSDVIGLNEPFPLVATSTSGLPVTFEVTGPAQITGGQLVATGAGTIVVKAVQAGNETYTPTSKTVMYNVRQAAISLVGEAPHSAPMFDLAVSGNFLYSANGEEGVEIFDVANPASPRSVGRYPAATDPRKIDARRIRIVGTTAYLIGSVINGDGFFLDCINISNPTNPIRLATFAEGVSPEALEVVGGVAYVCDGNGLSAFDVSNPAAPRQIVAVSEQNLVSGHSIKVVGSLVYVAGDYGLSVWDFQTPAQAHQVALYFEGIKISTIEVSDSLIYAVTPNQLIVLQGDATNLLIADTTPFNSGAVTGVQRSGDYLYLSERVSGSFPLSQIGGVEVFDASNPNKLLRVGGYRDWISPIRALVVADMIYVAGEATESFKILKTSLRQLSEPRLEMSLSTSGVSVLSAPALPGWRVEGSYSLNPQQADWQDYSYLVIQESDGVKRFNIGGESAFFRMRKVGF